MQFVVQGSGEPEGELEAAIVRDFGSVAAMKEKLSASTVAVQVLQMIESWRNGEILHSPGLRMGLAWVQQSSWKAADCCLPQPG